MNNTIYKNTEYKKDEKVGLPYSDILHIQYAEGTGLNAVRLNNTFKQLVDNDKAIEQSLVNLSSQVVGPKNIDLDSTADQSKLRNVENGYKFWQLGSGNQLSIDHKVDCDLQKSVFKTSLSAMEVYDFCQTAGKTFAATNAGLYTIDDNGNAELFTEYNDIDEQEAQQIICRDIFHDNYRTLFATSNGIYELNSAVSEQQTSTGTRVVSQPVLCKRNKTWLTECYAVYVRPDNGMILVSTHKGTYAGKYNSHTAKADIELEAVSFADQNTAHAPTSHSFAILSPNKQVVKQSNDLLALTDAGLYTSHILSSSVTEKDYVLLGADTKFTFEFEGISYVGTLNGVFDAKTENAVLSFPACSYAIANGILYLGSVGSVRKVLTLRSSDSKPIQAHEIKLPTDDEVVKLQSIGKYAKQDIGEHELLLCITSTGKTFTIDTVTGTVAYCKSFPAGYGSASNGRLVLANDNTELSVIQIGSTSGNTKSDTLANELALSKEYQDLVDVTPGQDHIVAQKTKLINVRSGKTYAATDITRLVKLNTPANEYEYAYIDDGKIALLNSNMTTESSQLSAHDITDTTHLLVGIDQSGMFTVDKDVFPADQKQHLDELQLSPSCQFAANGRFAYVLDGKSLSVLSEAYQLNREHMLSNAIRTSTCEKFDSYTEKVEDNEISVTLDASLVACNDVLSVSMLSSQGESDEGITVSRSFPMMLNDAAFDGNDIKVSTPTGLSTLHLSVNLSSVESPISIIGAEHDISGTSILTYHKVDVPSPYTFIASSNDVSVFHDEYKPIASFEAQHGKHLTDSAAKDDGEDHSFYALWNDSQLRIYDREKSVIQLDTEGINDVEYSLSGKAGNAKAGKVYIATSTGLSSYDAKTTLSSDVSAFDNLQLVSLEEFKQIKCLALSAEQVGIYLATDTAICSFNGDKLTALCDGFTNVQNLNGFAVKDLCALVFTDGREDTEDILKMYDMRTSKLSAFENVSAVSQLEVVGDTSENAVLSDLSLLWKSGDSLQTIAVTSLTAGGQPITLNSNAMNIYIFSDFRVNNHVTLDDNLTPVLDARRHSKTYVQTYDFSNSTYQLAEYSPVLDNPALMTSDTYVTYANFVEDQQCPAQYANDVSVIAYSTASNVILHDKRCTDFQSVFDTNSVSVFCRSGNDVLSIGFLANASIYDIIPDTVPALQDISAYSIIDGNVAYVSNDCFFDNIYDKENFIKLVNYSSDVSLRLVRMFAIDQIQSSTLSLAQDTIVIVGDDGTAYAVQKDATVLDQLPIAEYSPVDELVQVENNVYARLSSELSVADKATFVHEASLSSDSIVKLFPCEATDSKIYFYLDNDGWKYTFNGNTFKYVPQEIRNFSSHDIKDILVDKHTDLPNNTISVITANGIYTTKFIDQLKLSELGNVQTTVTQYPVIAVYGKEVGEGSDAFVTVLSSEDGLSAMSYDASQLLVSDKPVVKYSNYSAFDVIAPFDGRLDSNMFYAISGDQLFLTDANGSSGVLDKYNDERIAMYSANVNSASHANGKNWICTDRGTFISKENGKSLEFQYQSNSQTDFSSVISQNSLTSILAGNDGIYTLVNRGNALSTSVYKNSLCTDCTTALAQWDFTGSSPRYSYAISNVILTSDNCKEFSKLMCLPDDVSTVHCIYPLNMHDFFFGTDAGAYMTHYTYELSNDLKLFTAADARVSYDEIEDALDMTLSDAISVHETNDHAESSLITYLNKNFLPTDMSDLKLSSWGHASYNSTSSEMKVTDDLVDTIEFGDETTGVVTVTLSNFLTSDANAKCSYILKRYMSGLTELYVYLPTTNTYYLNHVYGLPGCTKSQATNIDRQNLYKFKVKPFAVDMSKHFSTFEIGIAAAALSIDTLLGVEACGNSLPLKCYRDKRFPDDDPNVSQLWHSYIEPTEVMTRPSDQQPNEDGEYKFKFACFGSDAQAVKIIAFDPVNNADAVRYTVRFNANGAQGEMTPQQFIAGVPYNLRACNFKWPDSDNKTFVGWTTVPNPKKDEPAKYADKQQFMLSKSDVKDGDIIDLYAIWISYNHDNANAFALADTKDELFFNYADVLSGEALGNIALVDYGK